MHFQFFFGCSNNKILNTYANNYLTKRMFVFQINKIFFTEYPLKLKFPVKIDKA